MVTVMQHLTRPEIVEGTGKDHKNDSRPHPLSMQRSALASTAPTAVEQ